MNKRRRLLHLLCACFIFVFLITPPFPLAAQDTREEAAQQAQKLIGWRKNVGIVVGVLTKDGQRVYAYGASGNRRLGKLDGDSVFEIGSISKVFTTILLADMVERQELNLTDPISLFLPGAVKTPMYQDKQITLLDLATHTSGLPRRPTNLKPKNEQDPYADFTVPQMYRFLSEYKLERAIGSKYEYSNIGMGLLGHILSLKAGTKYEDFVLRRLCNPLGMTSTRIRLSPELNARLATGHDRRGNPVSNWNIPEAIAGAGAFRSTVNDLFKFLAANLERTRTPLLPAMKNAYLPQRKTNSDEMIGLGWQIARRGGLEIIFHNGETGGYASFIGFSRKNQIGVVILANFAIEDDAAELGFRILEQVPAVD